MTPSVRIYEVVAIPKVGGEEMVLRRFRNHDAAAKHALAADMQWWDDIWVRPAPKPERVAPEPPAGPPPMPWSVLTVDGRTYIIDAQEKRLAVLFGSQAQREAVAAIIVEKSHATT